MNRARFAHAGGVSMRLDFVRKNLEKIWERGEALTAADAVAEMVVFL